MRDYENDKNTGKKTMVVKMGAQKAKIYHIALLSICVLSSFIYIIINNIGKQGYIFLIILVPIAFHVKRILDIKDAALFDKELKILALIALFFSIVFGIGINL